MAIELIELLIRANLVAALAALLILVLREPVRRLAGARSAYALWAAVPLAALAALLPADAAPIPILLEMPSELPALFALAPPAAASAAAPSQALDLTLALAGLWIAGVAACLIATGWRHQGYVRSLGRLTRNADGVFETQASGFGPAVLGAILPRIIVPADFEKRFAAGERTVILAHERTHLAGGDAQINGLIVLFQCLCWFNPIIHLAAQAARMDQELACDAAVLAKHPGARRVYAEALVKTQLATSSLPLGCYWPATRAHPLKRRLARLTAPHPRRARRLAGGLAVVLVGSACAYGAWAAKPVDAAVHVVTGIARAALEGDPYRLQGRVVGVERAVGYTRLAIREAGSGELWTVTSVGASGAALVQLANAGAAQVAIDGRLPRNGLCGPVACLAKSGAKPSAAPRPQLVRARTPAPAPQAADPVLAALGYATAPQGPTPGLPMHAERLNPDAGAPVLVRGAVTSVEWRYPNALIHMVSFPDGQKWQVIGDAPANLIRAGLDRDSIVPGSAVAVRGYKPTQTACTPDCKAVGASLAFEDGAAHPLWGTD